MQAFDIAPSSARPLYFFLPIALVMLVAFSILLVSLLGASRSRFEISAEGLRLRGDLYGRLVPRAQLRLDEARRIDLTSEAEYQPRYRTMGTALPGYRSGWFRLRNGGKALLYLTDFHRAVLIPTSAGYSILVSPSDPSAFLAALRTR